jgi:hypothetical protein
MLRFLIILLGLFWAIDMVKRDATLKWMNI